MELRYGSVCSGIEAAKDCPDSPRYRAIGNSMGVRRGGDIRSQVHLAGLVVHLAGVLSTTWTVKRLKALVSSPPRGQSVLYTFTIAPTTR